MATPEHFAEMRAKLDDEAYKGYLAFEVSRHMYRYHCRLTRTQDLQDAVQCIKKLIEAEQ